MEGTKIRWADNSWNCATGCTQISPGCEHCYAKTIAEKFGAPAFPNGFTPTWKPEKLGLPLKWREPRRIFVNSMSDLFHEAFADEQIDQAFAVMAEASWHSYQVLTKRPRRLERYIVGWLDRTGRTEVPGHIWLGTSIELDRYVWRAEVLRRIPVPIRFISGEPLLGPLPRLDLAGISWLIVGGESGPGFRAMDYEWARELRTKASLAGTAFFFKQSSAIRTEMGVLLDGERYEAYPDDSRYRAEAPGPTVGRGAGNLAPGTAHRSLAEGRAPQAALL